MTGRPPGSSSDGVSVRPRAALTPRTWKKFPVTSGPSSLRPSIHVSMSGVFANASAKTAVSRTSSSYPQARVKGSGSAFADGWRSTAKSSFGLRTSSARKMNALRMVKTTVTSPRPSPTVVTIVRAESGARGRRAT